MYTDTITIENTVARLRIHQGILYIVYKPGAVLDLKTAIQITADRLLLQREKTYPVFVDFRGVRHVSRAAREYFAREGSLLMQAIGVLWTLPRNQAIINFYIGINVSPVPIRAFTDKDSALNYLGPFTR